MNVSTAHNFLSEPDQKGSASNPDAAGVRQATATKLDRNLLVMRAPAIHEAGHVFGLEPRPDPPFPELHHHQPGLDPARPAWAQKR